MDKDDCSCRAQGRLFVHVDSQIEKQITITITEQHGYKDQYTIYLHNHRGDMRIDNIAYGKVCIESSIDENAIYYPNQIILFEKNDFIHKINIIDRRKENEEL